MCAGEGRTHLNHLKGIPTLVSLLQCNRGSEVLSSRAADGGAGVFGLSLERCGRAGR